MSAPAAAPRPERGWPRAAVLFFLVAMSYPVMLAVGYLAMVVGLPVRRWKAWILGLGMLVVAALGARAGFWWTERAWAVLVSVWFVVLTLARPEMGFLSRALGSIGAAGAVGAALLITRGDLWRTINQQIAERVHTQIGAVLEMQKAGTGGSAENLTPAVLEAFEKASVHLFPAMAALFTLGALAVAWWLYVWMAHGSDQGLLPLREFRFNDHLVWLFIGGLSLVLTGGGDGFLRVGSNAVLFMGALYALRGAAIAAFFGAGATVQSAIFLFLGFLFAAPVIFVGALVIGLGDTWLDLRARARAMTGAS